ncbi:MAG: hydrogenase maturation protease [Verrucomicrobia bacterium]|nr:hydrogenase maturation protease [Verrucomicrobiota bacterium]
MSARCGWTSSPGSVCGDSAVRPEADAAIEQPSAGDGAGETTVLILGLGNDILTDDAVGLAVARAVRERLQDAQTVRVVDTEEMGLSLLDFIAGHRELIIVDAIQTGKAPPGTVHEMDGDALCLLPRISPHFLGIGEILTLGRQLGLTMPGRVKIFAIEVADPFTLGTSMTAPVALAVPEVVNRVVVWARSNAAAAASDHP